MIRRYDAPETLFYLDPPYWNCGEDYGAGTFERADFERLAEQLSDISGKIVLSINDTPGARAVIGRFEVESVETTYTIAKATPGSGAKAGELIINGSGEHPNVLKLRSSSESALSSGETFAEIDSVIQPADS